MFRLNIHTGLALILGIIALGAVGSVSLRSSQKQTSVPSQSPSLDSGVVRYPDNEWTGFDKRIVERLLKLRELIGRDGKCKVAIYSSLARLFTTDYSRANPILLDGEGILPSSVDCIQDLTTDAGTVYEHSGCTLVSYSLKTASYSPYFVTGNGDAFPEPTSSQLCDQGGFEDLVAKTGWWAIYSEPNGTVEQSIFTPYIRLPWRSVLVYAEKPKYVSWFLSTREKVRTYLAEKNQPRKKKEAANKIKATRQVAVER